MTVDSRIDRPRGAEGRTARGSELSTEQLLAVLQSVGDAITVQAPDGTLVYANDAAAALLGFRDADELLATPVGRIVERFRMYAEDGRPFSPMDLPGRRVLLGETPGDVVVRFRQVDDATEHWSLVRATPIRDDGGRVAFAVNVFMDVTDRRLAQARLQALATSERTRAAEVDAVIRAIGDAVIVCDGDGFVTLMNPAAEQLLHGAVVSRFDDVLGMLEGFREVAPELGAPVHQGPFEIRMRGATMRWIALDTYPVIVQREPGEAFAEWAESSPQRPAAHERGRRDDPRRGAVTILVMRDITSFREAQQMREAFIGVLSHELRTPVTTIYGSAKVLGRGDARLSAVTRREVYADIEAESERLYRLVEDLLVLARFGDAPIDVANEPVLLQRILPAAIRAEEARWPTRRFAASIPPGLPTVEAEPTYVEQVTRNLLSNAAKYSPGGSRVELLLEGGVDEVVLRVRDEGPGFPPQEASRLFDLFYRSPLTAATASGAGIGLFVCRRLIEAMGGRMWAVNRDGGGAEFGFALRRFDEDDA